ncbi:MarR family transcriptional regulator [Porticoccaceae bacterium]|nr:MarR family transcriptional regulator [Porticoccaceae bacterium]
MPNTILDSEHRGSDSEHKSLRLWLRLLTCSNLVENHLRAKLRTEFNSTLPRFDLMAQLHRYPEGMRMGDLSKLMMVSGGNVTGICNQLEKEQVVVREVCSGDRRAFVVKLSKKGQRLFDKMSVAHESWLVELFAELQESDTGKLMDGLGQIKKSIHRLEREAN